MTKFLIYSFSKTGLLTSAASRYSIIKIWNFDTSAHFLQNYFVHSKQKLAAVCFNSKIGKSVKSCLDSATSPFGYNVDFADSFDENRLLLSLDIEGDLKIWDVFESTRTFLFFFTFIVLFNNLIFFAKKVERMGMRVMEFLNHFTTFHCHLPKRKKFSQNNELNSSILLKRYSKKSVPPRVQRCI